MTPENHSDLKTDVEKIAEDVGHLVDDLVEESAHLIDDAAGAEFLGAVDVVESVGASLELAVRLGDILGEQVRFAREDYSQTSEELKSLGTIFDLLSINNRHIERRAMHGIAGIAAWNKAILAEQAKLLEMNVSLWTPFQKILKKDLHLS
jgi:hypothetical protein